MGADATPATTNPRRNPDVRTTLLPDGHVVLFSTKTEWAHTLNPQGAVIWEFCDGSHSVDDIIEEVRQLMQEAAQEHVSRQVSEFINELLGSGLLQ